LEIREHDKAQKEFFISVGQGRMIIWGDLSRMIVGFGGQKRRLFGACIKVKISIAYMQWVGPFAEERCGHVIPISEFFVTGGFP
jgi:hypothetical protein